MSFLTPAAFAFALLLPLVILFYLLKRKRVVRVVPSTVLWQRFLADSQANAPFQKLRHNWLLILQLLLLALIILAVARPYMSGPLAGGTLYVAILDASASMQSRDEPPSRFERARSEALRLVDSLLDSDQMIVLVAGARAEVQQSATSNKAALRRALQSADVTDASTRILDALKIARSLTRDNPEAEMHLFSDGVGLDLVELESAVLPLVYHRVGQRADNLGIVNLDVRPNPENPRERAVFATVANASETERRTEVELLFDHQLIDLRSLTVPPTNSVPLLFLATQPRDGVFTVRLTAEDDLAADNQASVVSILPQPQRVLLVTRGNRFLERALRSAGQVKLTVAETLTDPYPPFDLVVLDDVHPAVWPDGNVLAIHAFDPAWFETVGTIELPPIVHWRSTHPLLRFITFDNVNIAQARAVEIPPWAESIVDSTQASLLLTGDVGRQRIVWIGFDLLESNWPLRVSFPIFIANAIDWLNPATIRAQHRLVPVGHPIRLPLTEPVPSAIITRPDGRQVDVPLDPQARELVYGQTSLQGVYRVRAGTRETLFAVNLLDPLETDTRPRDVLDLGRYGEVRDSTLRRANLEIWRWIAALGLAVLLLEWWYFHRRTA
jgi:Ca-activated chloride channel homolog